MFQKLDVFNLASKFQFFGHSGFNDFSDRLSFKFSVFLLLISGLLILLKQYFMKPISCYMSTDIGGDNLLEYIENYCWVEGTIPITLDVKLPTNEEEWNRIQHQKMLYYQWVPFILHAQAILFYIPQLIWRLFYTKESGIDLKHLMVKANNASNLDSEARSKEVIQLAHALETLLFQTREYRTGKLPQFKKSIHKFSSLCIASKRMGTHLMVFYLFVKLLYLINSIGQIYIMQTFLNLKTGEYPMFGIKILHDIMNGKDWQNTNVFSRVSYCFAKIRQLGVINYAIAQCVLPVNMLNEKLYIFLYFWMLLVSFTTSISLVVWIIRLILNNEKTAFIRKYLILNDEYKFGEKCNRRIKRFEDYFLKNDGIFILHMLNSNAGEIITAEIISQLWKIYRTKYDAKLLKQKSLNSNENLFFQLDDIKIEDKMKSVEPSAPKLFKQYSLNID